jgi:5-oxopent-3-ene-1,2,5-tricarboxylate decarboxylase / 2-hydroxyhepta-2,4-diene-1,7-dioate isomerase
VDIREQTVRTYINGKCVQDGPVSEMTFPIDYIMADLCRFITFLPGDIVLTGTPANSRPMQPGDLVEVEVTQIGRLSNRVQDIPVPQHELGAQPTDSDNVRRVALGKF